VPIKEKTLMIRINVILDNISWKKYIKNPKSYFRYKIDKLNKKNKLYKKNCLVFTLMLSRSSKIKQLNKKFRNKNKSTDVLSFPFYNKVELLKLLKVKNKKEIFIGDIIINLQKIRNKSDKKNFLIELDKLWVHGLAHLFGHRHKIDRDFFKMNKIEKEFLKHLN
tara:strand:+ start:1562 stop:2056 length:495 start_codon:yes stop_codon:yes gene_type:complete